MSAQCNLYLDKGADFYATVIITGINNAPVCVHNWKFISQAQLIYNPKIKIDIVAQPDERIKGAVNLYIPAHGTERMPTGNWQYDIEMTYKKWPPEVNKKIRVLSGKLVVNENITTCGW